VNSLEKIEKEFIIKYADDDAKKERIKAIIRDRQGISAHELYLAMNMASRTYQNTIREMVADGDFIVENVVKNHRNVICHYVNA
jgi:lambda repressor-like predicted transcriptional regulator